MKGELVANGNQHDEWKHRIEDAWHKSVASVIEVGKLVKQAKEDLGASFSLLETELPFSSTVAAFLIKISEHPVLSNPAYFNNLPNGYNTLYYLASVEEEELVAKIKSGDINPNFSLANAKALREVAPKKGTAKKTDKEDALYEVGSIKIGLVNKIDEFEKELNELLTKYNGKVKHTHTENSLADLHRQKLLEKAVAKIEKTESELATISLDDMRMLEDAAHFMQKTQNQKNRIQITLDDGTIVDRTGIPEDYKDYERLVELIGQKEISRGTLKRWCVEHKVPGQFVELTSIDKELYLWEQVRLVTDKKDAVGGLKRLKSMASRSTIPHIKKLAAELVEEVERFSNKA